MRLYLVRHGQTDMNKRNMFYGWTDADINETGVQQAEQLRQYFRQIPIDAIYSSDLKRAAHTAEIIADGKDMKVHYDSAFRELYYGDWENQTTEYIEKNYKEELRGWVTDWKDLAMPNGEKFSDFYNRVAAGVDRLVEENRGKNVLLVAHNGALSAMLCHLTGAGMDGFWRFDSKQGHYSSVLISKSGRPLKVLTILYVWRRNGMKAKCHNMEKKDAVFPKSISAAENHRILYPYL